MSRVRDAALAYDLGATLWRVSITQDNRELRDLLPEQLHALAQRYPDGCDQRIAIERWLAATTPTTKE